MGQQFNPAVILQTYIYMCTDASARTQTRGLFTDIPEKIKLNIPKCNSSLDSLAWFIVGIQPWRWVPSSSHAGNSCMTVCMSIIAWHVPYCCQMCFMVPGRCWCAQCLGWKCEQNSLFAASVYSAWRFPASKSSMGLSWHCWYNWQPLQVSS